MRPFEILKNTLAIELEKQGHSLLDLEDALAHLDEAPGIMKSAELMTKAAGFGLDTAWNMGLTATTGAGAALGLGLDAVENNVKGQNTKLDEMRRNVAILKHLKDKLKAEHGIL